MSARMGFSVSMRVNTALVQRFIGPGSRSHTILHGHLPIPPSQLKCHMPQAPCSPGENQSS
jgi:hypothetical protein